MVPFRKAGESTSTLWVISRPLGNTGSRGRYLAPWVTYQSLLRRNWERRPQVESCKLDTSTAFIFYPMLTYHPTFGLTLPPRHVPFNLQSHYLSQPSSHLWLFGVLCFLLFLSANSFSQGSHKVREKTLR